MEPGQKPPMRLPRLGMLQHRLTMARLEDEPWAQGVGLRPPTFGVMRVISVLGPVSQREVSDHLGVHASDMVGIVDALEANGWVTRRRSPTDRRRYDLLLTVEGWEVLRRMELIAEEVEETFLLVLSDTERDLLDGLLTKLAESHMPPLSVRAPSVPSP